MKSNISLLLIISILLSFIIVAGCTDNVEGSDSTPQTSITSIYDISKFKWLEYNTKLETGTTITRITYDTEIFQNTEVRHTLGILKVGNNTMLEWNIYYDKINNNVTGVEEYGYIGGVRNRLKSNDFNTYKNSYLMDPVLYYDTHGSQIGKLKNLGTETITVPYGTYQCTKYQNADIGGYFWMTPSVPVPVKIVIGTTTQELTGLG